MPSKDIEARRKASRDAMRRRRQGLTLDKEGINITYGQDADGRLTKTIQGVTYRLPKDWGTWSVFESAMAACNRADAGFIPLKKMSPSERHQRFAYDLDGKPSGKELDSLPEIREEECMIKGDTDCHDKPYPIRMSHNLKIK